VTAPAWQQFVPKLYSTLRGGYSLPDLRADAVAGLTVAVVALPLAMALAIASGTTPEKGLHTAIVAGFLISALGGSRVQIGGPTAAFIPVVFDVLQRFGHEGLILCTLLAGLMLIAAGLLRLGTLMKFMPQPVITGFTAGIAVSIVTSQVKDFFGLPLDELPGDFVGKWQAYAAHAGDANALAVTVALACLGLILALRRWQPRAPAFLVAVVAGSLAALALGSAVPTIGSAFGSIPSTLPAIAFPHIPFERTAELLPASFTIAFLAGVESLLSAVVADGMTGGRHRSNGELVAQGVANVGAALIGGLPATGAIARTATNVRAGARSPVSGMLHAAFLLGFMLLLAPLMRWVPLAALAAVLMVVAWNMSEVERFRHLLRAPWGDRVVLVLTFVLTVTVDLTVAIQVGVVLAAFLFMHRISESVEVEPHAAAGEMDDAGDDEDQRAALPPGVEAFRISGPLFFAVANRLDRALDPMLARAKVFVLRLRRVPMIDASGATALHQLLDRCHHKHVRVIFSGLQAQPRDVVEAMHLTVHPALLGLARDFDEALAMARQATGQPPAASGLS
jgi:SulP family sulfate permease